MMLTMLTMTTMMMDHHDADDRDCGEQQATAEAAAAAAAAELKLCAFVPETQQHNLPVVQRACLGAGDVGRLESRMQGS